MVVEDLLEIEMPKEMNSDNYATLTLLYLPLIGQNAYQVYMTLVSFAEHNIPVTNHKLLAISTGLSIKAVEEARKKCEEFQLIRTYYNEDTKQYLYIIDTPLKSSRFLAHEVFGRLYIQKMGKDVVNFYKKQLKQTRKNKSGYKEITNTMNDLLRHNWNDNNENVFQDVKEEMHQLDYNLHIIFDEKEFLNGLSFLIFPKNQRTKKNLRSIAEIATIYGMNEKMMKRLINKGMKQPENVYDATRLKEACLKSKAKYIVDTKDPYTLPPRRFLETKLNGASLPKGDVYLIEKLIKEYRMQPEVINYLLETCLARCDQKIIPSFVERMAGGWMRKGIDNVEDAKKQMALELQTNKYASKNKKQAIVQTWDSEEEEMSEEDRIRLIKEIEAMGGN